MSGGGETVPSPPLQVGPASTDAFRGTPPVASALVGTNPRIHLKWNSGFDPSFGVLSRATDEDGGRRERKPQDLLYFLSITS